MTASAGPTRRRTASALASTPNEQPADAQLHNDFLDGLLGYNLRRASVHMIGHFAKATPEFGLSTVSFSVLSVVGRNPGVTSRALCQALLIQPPNLVGIINVLKRRSLLERRPHPHDGRAFGLHLSTAGMDLLERAEQAVSHSEQAASATLTDAERQSFIKLLQRIYQP